MAGIIAQAILFLVLLALIGFFSTAQSAVFGLKGNDIAELKDARDAASKQVVKLLGSPRNLLMSVITGNMLSTIAIGVLGAVLSLELARGYHWNQYLTVIIGLIILTLVVILVGEVTPKVLALNNTRRVSRAIIFPLAAVSRLLYPMASLVFQVTKILSRLFGVTKENLFMSDEEIRTLVEVSEIQGALQEEEKAMIYSIFEFGETAVREIMIPRIDMVAVPIDMRINEVLDLIKKHRFSRMPLYDKRVDNITGIIFAKDLLPFLDKKSANLEVGTLGRPLPGWLPWKISWKR
ncbi:MAG: CNNM domain-containing protein [Calditrichota bacterium]